MIIDPRSKLLIDRRVELVLRDAGFTAPPVDLETVLDALRVNREYYDLGDPGFLRRIAHRLRVEGTQLIKLLGKVKLSAVWAPEESRILIDRQLPPQKQVWAGYHDAAHRMIPWHREMFLGDTAQTLSPDYHEELEAEANYGGSGLLFCGSRFTEDAGTITPNWKSVTQLAKVYKASLTTTLRRFVSHGPRVPMIAMVCTPVWGEHKSPGSRARHVVVSDDFRSHFEISKPDFLLAIVEAHLGYRRKGPIAEFETPLAGRDGALQRFDWEVFDNTHDLLVLAVAHPRIISNRTPHSRDRMRVREH
jgi:hypothetical protein